MKKTSQENVIVEPAKPLPRSRRPEKAMPIGATERKRAPNGTNGGAHERNGEVDLKEFLHALTTLKKGDFSARLPVDWVGVSGKVADVFNEVAELMEDSTADLNRINRVVGKEGKINERMTIGNASGDWSQRIKAVNNLIDRLVHPISETARVIGAVAKGDLSQTMALEIDGRPLEGEFLRTARTVNTMVDQLGGVASGGTPVGPEVGTEGKMGGQGPVKSVARTWEDLTG